MKKIKDELSDYQKALVLGVFIFFIFFLIFWVTGNWQYELSFLSFGVAVASIYVLVVFKLKLKK
ncbi:hypothetical protein [Candidatus Absconditicoccus praedator]|uniref:hypothetical protein n=1 Tax=Candidatus Absconditicoccus praedator TaxID=2735562 RepID=UPI001E62BBF8|nr:hypothetical protein [Candidatus Absconditicoccus praedator]UFX83139.1 hypothetical protein HLG78_03320 [Candidatus Absconditicoccus praedator]